MSSGRSGPELLRAGEPVFREFLTALVLHGQVMSAAVGASPTDFYGLNLLGALGPMTAGQLAERTGLTTGAVTRLIDRLERAGFVRRTVDPGDRRKVVVQTVAEEVARLGSAFEPARRRLAEVFGSYSPEQLAVLFDFFAKAAPALRDAALEAR